VLFEKSFKGWGVLTANTRHSRVPAPYGLGPGAGLAVKLSRYRESIELKALDARLRGHDEKNTPMAHVVKNSLDWIYMITV